ncbi:MAG: hypothetical protein JXM73_06055, partial [Anaerolineae bacterium]|nr:hypothetical protein [Anaerolineae bacterium]
TLDWQWGTYAWVGGGCYGTSHVQPPTAYSGTDMWGTVLNTCYSDLGNNANSCANVNPNDDSILSITLDLTYATGNVELSWWEWYDLFGSFDWAEVRANGDVVWQNCESHVAPTAWEQQTVDLTAYAGGPVTIEFHMMASTVVNYAGWYIDDVMVTGERSFSLEAWKDAPATAEHGDVISYTITISTTDLLPGMFMADPLPAGVEYAGNLSWTGGGNAWYSPTVNTVFWEYAGEPRTPATPPPAVPAAVDASLGQPAPKGAPFSGGAAVPFGGGATMAILDDFDRADGPIGPNWTVHDGYCNVSNNAAVCGNIGRATFNSAPGDGNVAEADVAVNGAALQYTGLLLNYGAGSTNLYLKVQDNDAIGQFTHAACYTGNNGASFGLGFFPLSAPFNTAHMRATRAGSDVTIEFTNIDGGGGSQTYVCSGAPAPEGTGIGILGYAGIARLDNFGLPGEEPQQVQVTFDVTVTGHCGDVIVNEGVAGFDTLVETFSATTVVEGEPALAVSPPVLDIDLCPDTTGVLTLTVCNAGDCPLVWALHEMTPTLKVVSIPPSDGNFPRGEGAPSAGPAPIEALPDDVPITPLVPTGLQILGTGAYATEAVNGFHTLFDLSMPGFLPNLGAFAPGGFPGAGEYVNGYIYVADGTNTLYQLDPATGAVLSSYPITAPPNGETYSGFALDPTSGMLYGSSTNISTSSLLQVDPTTGVATLIGPITGSACNIAIAIDGTGQVYGYDICTDDFWAIDKNTGAGTMIGLIGFDANFGQGMGWDPVTDQMYMAAFNFGTFQPELRVVDLTTGNTAMVGGPLGSTFPTGICQLPWLGIPAQPVFPDLPWISEDPISGTLPW